MTLLVYENLNSKAIQPAGFQTGIVADTGRAQATATPLSRAVNRVTTATSISAGTLSGDGVLLPPSYAGTVLTVSNSAAAPITVYAQGSDTINGIAGATGVPLMPGAFATFTANAVGVWTMNASGGVSGGLSTLPEAVGIAAVTPASQATAYQIIANINRVITVDPAGAAVALPAAARGLVIVIMNTAANYLTVYPINGGTDQINGLSANASVAIPPNTTVTFTGGNGPGTAWTTSPFMTAAGILNTDQISNLNAQSTATLSKTNDAALANIVGLSIPLTAGATYNMRLRLNGTSGATGGVKVSLAGSGFGITTMNVTTWNYNGTTLNAVTNVTALGTALTDVAAVYTDIVAEGTFVVATGGNLIVQGAQHASNGTATTFLGGGCSLVVTRVA